MFLCPAVPRTLAVIACSTAMSASAQPQAEPWPVANAGNAVAVAAAPLGGYVAIGDTLVDQVDVRTAEGVPVRLISRSELLALSPWMSLEGGPDGPATLAFTATGKQLFILVHDDTAPPDGQGSDSILRYDLPTNSLVLFARADMYDRGDAWPHLAAAHFKAILYTGAATGQIRAHLANSAAGPGLLLAAWTLPTAGPIRGLAIDHDTGTLFAANDAAIYRTVLTNSFAQPPTWTLVGNAPNSFALAWGDSFGSPANRGLYVLASDGSIGFISAAAAFGGVPTTPTGYLEQTGAGWHDLAIGGDGAMYVAANHETLRIRDQSDPRPNFEAWLRDEFSQVVRFGRGLISPDGEPAGWVIDGDTLPALPRFHPATPDAAAWTVLLLLANAELNADPAAQAQVRTILRRYGGLATDGISPSRTPDGIFRHWIDPSTGSVKAGWDPEFATMSTMKIVAAAARAMAHYPDDPEIALAASRIIFRTRNWDSYIQPGTFALYLKGLATGGPDTTVPLRPFHEGILFIGQAAAYGGPGGDAAYAAWLNRAQWPTASYIPSLPITVISANVHEAAFLSLYPALLQPEYRASPAWRTQVGNLRWSNAAWTDDSGPRFSTVFSAGTTRSDWGGYRADTLGNHPGNVTTFTSLMALSAFGDPTAAVQAYHAFRKDARQTFRTGASILYRRSDVDRTYLPNSAGLPDVALGGLALGELIEPGLIDRVLARPFPQLEMCPVDLTGDGQITVDDLYHQQRAPTDLNGDGVVNTQDAASLRNWLRRHDRRDCVPD